MLLAGKHTCLVIRGGVAFWRKLIIISVGAWVSAARPARPRVALPGAPRHGSLLCCVVILKFVLLNVSSNYLKSVQRSGRYITLPPPPAPMMDSPGLPAAQNVHALIIKIFNVIDLCF